MVLGGFWMDQQLDLFVGQECEDVPGTQPHQGGKEPVQREDKIRDISFQDQSLRELEAHNFYRRTHANPTLCQHTKVLLR